MTYTYKDGQILKHGTVITLYDAELTLWVRENDRPPYKQLYDKDTTAQLAKAIEAFKRDMVTS